MHRYCSQSSGPHPCLLIGNSAAAHSLQLRIAHTHVVRQSTIPVAGFVAIASFINAVEQAAGAALDDQGNARADPFDVAFQNPLLVMGMAVQIKIEGPREESGRKCLHDRKADLGVRFAITPLPSSPRLTL